MHKLPNEVSAYIKEYFVEGYLSDIQTSNDTKGLLVYNIVINDNELIHYLKFSKDGKLIRHRTEPLFEEDYYEGNYYGIDDY